MSAPRPSLCRGLGYTRGMAQRRKPPLSSTLHHVQNVQQDGTDAVSWANLHEKMQREGDTLEISNLYKAWIASIKELVTKYGENRIPQDIKWAMNSAEEGVGVEKTVWENPPKASLFGN